MTKAQLIAKIILKINSDKDETEVIVEAFFKTIQLSLENREDVFLRGFGTFSSKKRASKMGQNITKNLVVVIPECYRPAFKPAKEFLEKVKAANKLW